MEKSKSKRVKTASLLLAVAVIGTATAVLTFGMTEKQQEEPRLREYKATIGDITVGVDASAMIAYQQTEYYLKGAGKLGALFVKAGDFVQKGDPLAELSAQSLQEELEKLQMEHQKANIQLANAKDDQALDALSAQSKLDEVVEKKEESKFTLQEAELAVKEAQENIYRARKRIRDLKGDLEDLEDSENGNDATDASIRVLEDQLYTARQEAERAELLLERAKLTLERLKLKQKKEDGSTLQEEQEINARKIENTVRLAELELQRIATAINRVQQAQNNRLLLAEQDGIVMATGYAVGEEVGAKAVVTLGDVQSIQAVAMVEQADIGKLKPDQTVEARMEAYPDDLLTGTVQTIHFLPEKNGNNVFYKVFFTLDVSQVALHEGMTGEVTFLLKKKASVLKLSNKAITLRDGKQYVLMQNEDGTTYEVEITTGFSDGRFSEVLSGLQEGQTVVVEDKIA